MFFLKHIKLIPLLLTAVIIAQTFVGLFIVLDFLVHQKEIAETLCVQKDDQQGCNGKCHLVVELENAVVDSTKDSQDNRVKIKINFDSIFQSNKTSSNGFVLNSNLIFFKNSNSPIEQRYYDVLTPPPNFI